MLNKANPSSYETSTRQVLFVLRSEYRVRCNGICETKPIWHRADNIEHRRQNLKKQTQFFR